jgi:hypothetical protein
MVFTEYNDDNTTNVDEGDFDLEDQKTAIWRSGSNHAQYRMTLGDAEDVTTYDGVDISSYGIKKVAVSDVCIDSGVSEFRPQGWTPTYWDGNSSQPITDIVTFTNQYIAKDSAWWDSYDGDNIYMLAEHDAVVAGESASGDLVAADANGSYENCESDNCTIYVRSNKIIGSWELSSNGVLTETIPNVMIKKYKYTDGKLEEAFNDAEGRISNNTLYIGLSVEIMKEIEDKKTTK